MIAFALCAVLVVPLARQVSKPSPVTVDSLSAAGALVDISFDESECKLMAAGVRRNLQMIRGLHDQQLENSVFPAITFSPFLPGIERRALPLATEQRFEPGENTPERPADLEQLCFWSIPRLSSLIRGGGVTCVELTQTFISRLERIDSELFCVITLTEDRALAQAAVLDAELAAGHWRGPLHGIPWGAKDLLAVAGSKTTWGAESHRDQVLDFDASVVRQLDEAGAILIAKLSMGALAWGDVWFDGTTRNPWNPEQGSSGSSAGSCSATAAGGVAFALGTETLGSIVSPSARCGNSSLRPTFGRVNRSGAMALSWTMDKIGPICRSAQDAAIVLEAIVGPGGPREPDPSMLTGEYHAPGLTDVSGMRIGFSGAARKRSGDLARVLTELEGLGCELVERELPAMVEGLEWLILNVEAAAAFDAFTREGLDDELVRQEEMAWPNSFRLARLVPAVEYVQANRLRTLLCQAVDRAFAGIDVYCHPSFGDGTLQITNLTGHPTFVAPSGFRANGTPRSISFTGQLLGEEQLLALVIAWQEITDHHLKHPEGL